METHEQHKAGAPHCVRVAIVTVSDTRTLETDASGAAIEALVQEAGHRVVRREVVLDDAAAIAAVMEPSLASGDIEAVVLTGGTGVGPRDVTVEAVSPLLDKALPGFGELFRMLSYEEVGSAALLSRATAGVARGKVVFALPGSVRAARLAMIRLVLPELGHLVHEVRGRKGGHHGHE